MSVTQNPGAAFDGYRQNYGDEVQSSIDFSGLSHDFFLRAKVDLLRDVIATRLQGRSDVAALDAGCGVGAMHPLLRGMFGSLHGVDVSSACVEEARARHPDVSYASYDGVRLPYDDAQFDLVFTVCVVHHVPVSQWPDYIGELRRVTRPGGAVCVIEHNPFNPLTRLAVARCEFDRDATLLKRARTESLLRDAGLVDIASRYFLLFPFESAPTRRIERWLSRMPLGAQYLSVGRV